MEGCARQDPDGRSAASDFVADVDVDAPRCGGDGHGLRAGPPPVRPRRTPVSDVDLQFDAVPEVLRERAFGHRRTAQVGNRCYQGPQPVDDCRDRRYESAERGESAAKSAGPKVHVLKPTPKTVVWGYYDAASKPVLKIKSGDIKTPDMCLDLLKPVNQANFEKMRKQQTVTGDRKGMA